MVYRLYGWEWVNWGGAIWRHWYKVCWICMAFLVLYLYTGGNDIGHTETPCGLLTYQIKVTLVSLFIEILPGCPIIWSSILPRIKWRLSKKHNKNGKNKEANQASCQILLFEQKLLCHKISRFWWQAASTIWSRWYSLVFHWQRYFH